MSPPVALPCSRLDNKIIGQTTGGGKFQICLDSIHSIDPITGNFPMTSTVPTIDAESVKNYASRNYASATFSTCLSQ
jgi:hypothetical protein